MKKKDVRTYSSQHHVWEYVFQSFFQSIESGLECGKIFLRFPGRVFGIFALFMMQLYAVVYLIDKSKCVDLYPLRHD